MRVLILGAGGFIGTHLARRLKKAGYFIKGVDVKLPDFGENNCDEFVLGDLRDFAFCESIINESFDELYQLAADMGGAGYIFTGENDYDVVHNSSLINLNITSLAIKHKVKKVFFSSSACIYPVENQLDPFNPTCSEGSAYPANPDSEYGWEKLFSERLYLSAARNYSLNIRIARFHNVYGPLGTYNNGKEKAPAALCRKVAEAISGDAIEVWGSGKQTRSFLFIDDCLDGITRLMDSDYIQPINIGSEEVISLDEFARMIIEISGKNLTIKHVSGPVGVNGRNSDNRIAKQVLKWEPSISLREGITQTYHWIAEQVEHGR